MNEMGAGYECPDFADLTTGNRPLVLVLTPNFRQCQNAMNAASSTVKSAQMLDSIGRVIGESVETVNIQAPELTIKIQDKPD